MTTFAIFNRTRATGPNTPVRAVMIGATRSATRSVCWMANVFGVTSANTNRSSVMRTVDTSSAK